MGSWLQLVIPNNRNMPNTTMVDDFSYSPSPLRILHLEDDTADASFLAWTLRTAGIKCRIIRVEDEKSFAAALKQGQLDLILSDSSVPGFSGLAALELVRAANVDAPFVFVSGSGTPEIKAAALQRGAADYLLKDHRIELVFLAQRLWQNKSDA